MKSSFGLGLLLCLVSACAVQQEEVKEVGTNGFYKTKGTLENGHRNGRFEEFDSLGVLQSVTTWYEGYLQGEYQLFYPSGKLKETGYYLDGALNGKRVLYDSLGGYSTCFYDEGVKSGIEEFYDHDKILTKKHHYTDNGLLSYTQHFDVLGEITKRELSPYPGESDDTIKLGVAYAFPFQLATSTKGNVVLEIGQVDKQGHFHNEKAIPSSDHKNFTYLVKPDKSGMQHFFYRVQHTPNAKDTASVSHEYFPFFYVVE